MPTLTVNVGMIWLWQIIGSPPLVGGLTVGHEQFGEVTDCVVVQPFKVDVKITFVPAAMPVTVPAILSTVPDVLVTVPLLVKEIE